MAVAASAPQILDTTIKAEQELEDAATDVLTEARSRLARVVMDKVTKRFIESASADPRSMLRKIRLRNFLNQLNTVKRTLGEDRKDASLKNEFGRLETDAEALQAIEQAQKLADDAKACRMEVEAMQVQAERTKSASAQNAVGEKVKKGTAHPRNSTGEKDDRVTVMTHEQEIALMKKRGQIVDDAMKMLHAWKNHSEVAHFLCDALLGMAESCGTEFREEMDRRGLGVLASTVADLWLQRPEVARCALLLLSTVSIPLLLGMLEEQSDHSVLVVISLEVLNRRARESVKDLDEIVFHGGKELLEVIQKIHAGNRMISLHALSLQRRLAKSNKTSHKKRREVTLAPEEAVRLRKAFDTHDTGGLGYITDEQLRQTMEALGIKMSDEELKATMDEVDVDRSGTISWPEFVFVMSKFGAGQSIEHKFTEGRLKELRNVFDMFDAN
jgi:Ca2+-binding EF-hand superfamily protein